LPLSYPPKKKEKPTPNKKTTPQDVAFFLIFIKELFYQRHPLTPSSTEAGTKLPTTLQLI